MKLFLVERKDEVKYDEFRAIVVVAKNSNRAKKVIPCDFAHSYWNNLKATYLGEAKEGLKENSIITADYRAG